MPGQIEPVPPRPGLTIRRAGRDDIQVLAELDLVLPQHQGLSPTFSSGAGVWAWLAEAIINIAATTIALRIHILRVPAF